MTTDTFVPTARQIVDSLDRSYGEDRFKARRLKFADALTRCNHPHNVLPFLMGLGHRIRAIDDLLGLNDAIAPYGYVCFAVVEGIMVVWDNGLEWLILER